eukprot:PhF_6_TR32114/c0_g2_i1/m.47509
MKLNFVLSAVVITITLFVLNNVFLGLFVYYQSTSIVTASCPQTVNPSSTYTLLGYVLRDSWSNASQQEVHNFLTGLVGDVYDVIVYDDNFINKKFINNSAVEWTYVNDGHFTVTLTKKSSASSSSSSSSSALVQVYVPPFVFSAVILILGAFSLFVLCNAFVREVNHTTQFEEEKICLFVEANAIQDRARANWKEIKAGIHVKSTPSPLQKILEVQNSRKRIQLSERGSLATNYRDSFVVPVSPAHSDGNVGDLVLAIPRLSADFSLFGTEVDSIVSSQEDVEADLSVVFVQFLLEEAVTKVEERNAKVAAILEEVNKALKKTDGAMCSVTGTSFVAAWGGDNHVSRACEASIILSATFTSRSLHHGIVLHSSQGISLERMKCNDVGGYEVIGLSGSVLQVLNLLPYLCLRMYDSIIVTESTAANNYHHHTFIPLHLVRYPSFLQRGPDATLRVYTLESIRPPDDLILVYNSAVQAMWKQNLILAERNLQEYLTRKPNCARGIALQSKIQSSNCTAINLFLFCEHESISPQNSMRLTFTGSNNNQHSGGGGGPSSGSHGNQLTTTPGPPQRVNTLQPGAMETSLIGRLLAPPSPGGRRTNSSTSLMSSGYVEDIEDSKSVIWRRSDFLLGSGTSGDVFLGMGPSGFLVAVKCIPIKGIASNENLLRETHLMSSLSHDSLVKFYSVAIKRRHLMIMSEYVAGGTLDDVLKRFGAISEKPIRHYLRSILQGLAYLHSKNVTHRDIKPKNLYITGDGTCKIGDLGEAVIEGHIRIHDEDEDEPTVAVGTPMYMSPEACRGRHVPNSDVWSLGISVCQLVSNRMPFPEGSMFTPKTFMAQMATDQSFMPLLPLFGVSEELNDLLGKMLVRDPVLRMSSSAVLGHKFFLKE